MKIKVDPEKFIKKTNFFRFNERKCVVTVIDYNREISLLQNMVDRSAGQKVAVVVGINHLEPIQKFLLDREAILK